MKLDLRPADCTGVNARLGFPEWRVDLFLAGRWRARGAYYSRVVATELAECLAKQGQTRARVCATDSRRRIEG